MSFIQSLDFDIPVSDRCDSYGRYKLYMEEMRQSTRIIRQLIPMYKETEPQLDGSRTSVHLCTKRRDNDTKLCTDATLCTGDSRYETTKR